MRLIDADRLKWAIKEEAKLHNDAAVVYALFLILAAIDDAPVIDPINGVVSGTVRCDNCNSFYTYTSNSVDCTMYCPYCGKAQQPKEVEA